MGAKKIIPLQNFTVLSQRSKNLTTTLTHLLLKKTENGSNDRNGNESTVWYGHSKKIELSTTDFSLEMQLFLAFFEKKRLYI